MIPGIKFQIDGSIRQVMKFAFLNVSIESLLQIQTLRKVEA